MGEVLDLKRLSLGFYQPIGTTDSEYAFCWLIGRIREQFPQAPRRPEALWRHVHALTQELNPRGVCNFLLSDARYLYAHCSTQLSWLTRRAPFGKAQLMDADMTVDFEAETTPNDIVTVVATRPLTDNEPWMVMRPGTLVIFGAGEPVAAFDA